MTLDGFDGRAVVVTGAPGGQGLAAALLLDEAGARVIATDIADAAPAPAGAGVVSRQLDVSDEAGWRSRGSWSSCSRMPRPTSPARRSLSTEVRHRPRA